MYLDHALRGGFTGTPTALSDAAFKALKPRPFWARMYDRFLESRARKADQEIRMHLQHMPEDTLRRLVPEHVLKRLGYEATLSGSKNFPFVRQ
ncbi:MAG TPA: hypothetical protein VIG34_01780 [Xanthobacteraceae bacterium]